MPNPRSASRQRRQKPINQARSARAVGCCAEELPTRLLEERDQVVAQVLEARLGGDEAVDARFEDDLAAVRFKAACRR